MDVSDRLGQSALHELHLRTSQLDQVAILERYRVGTDRRAIERRIARAFDMVHDKTVRPLGDRRHGNPGLADRRDDFDQRHFAPRRSAAEHSDGGVS